MRLERARRQRRQERRREAKEAGARSLSAPPPIAPGAWLLLPALIVVAAIYAYHGSFRGPFIFDDLRAIPANPTIRSLSSALSPPTRGAVTGRPVVNLSLALNYANGGLDVFGYHVVNLSIHILSALILYGVVRRTLLSSRLRSRYAAAAPWLALAVALIWTVHPLQTESVTYVIQRTELLMGLFFLLTLYCVIRGVESARPSAWFAGAVVASTLGMGSKEVMVVAPVVVLAYDSLLLSDSFRETFRRRWGLYAGLAASWLVFLALAQTRAGNVAGEVAVSEITPWRYLMTQSGVIVHYLRLVFWPHPLVADYDDWPVAHSIASVLPWVAIVIALLGATAWAAYRRNPLGFVGVWFFLILAPTSSVWPLVKEIAAERRMYLPLAAVIALVVVGGYAGLRQICGRAGRPALARLIGGIAVVAIVATLAQLTAWRNEDYRSTESFWRDVIVKRPGDVRARVNMGDYLYKRGRAGEALAQYAEAVRLRPSDGPSQYGLAVVLASQGKLDEAIAHYSESVRISPDDAQAHVGFGVALDRRGRLDEAIAQYEAALRVNPDYGLAHYNLGGALARQGKLDEAIAQYSDAVRIDPNDADAHASLAATLVSAGKLHDAIAHYSEALRIAPSAWAHYNLAMTLARDGKTREATQHLEAALRFNPGFAQARRALEELTSSSIR